jgi:hypothetical protein
MHVKKLLVIVLVAFSQSGCFVGAAVGGSFMVQSTMASGASYAVSGKGISDHAISEVSDQDCKLFNLASGKPVCQQYAPIPINDKNKRMDSSRQTKTD